MYLLQPVPPPVRDPGLHPPGQRQQLVVPLPPLGLLRLLSPFLLRLVRVRLVLPLQPAPLPGQHHPLRLVPAILFLLTIVLFIFLPGAGGRGAIVSSQERALPAGYGAAVVAGSRPGFAPVPVILLAVVLRGALEVGLGSGGGGGGREGPFVTVVQYGSGQADLPLLGCGHLGFPHRREHFPLV